MPRKVVKQRRHHVEARVDNIDLTKSGTSLHLTITGNEKIGEIQIGRGSFTWFGRNKKKGCRITWTKFAKLIEENT